MTVEILKAVTAFLKEVAEVLVAAGILAAIWWRIWGRKRKEQP